MMLLVLEFGGNLRPAPWWRTNINIEFYNRQQRGIIEGEAVVTVSKCIDQYQMEPQFYVGKENQCFIVRVL